MVSGLLFVGSMAFFFLFLILKFEPHFFTSGSDDKESTCNAGDLFITPIHELDPEGNGCPLQYSRLKNFMDRGA